MEYKLRKAEPRDVSDILRLVKVGREPEIRSEALNVISFDVNGSTS